MLIVQLCCLLHLVILVDEANGDFLARDLAENRVAAWGSRLRLGRLVAHL